MVEVDTRGMEDTQEGERTSIRFCVFLMANSCWNCLTILVLRSEFIVVRGDGEESSFETACIVMS